MGTLMGHVLPGSFFIVVSVWWLWVLLHRYFKSKLPKGKTSTHYEFKSALSVSCGCSGYRLPLLGLIIITLVSIGILGEAYTGFRDGRFVVQGNGQHITMYFFFGMVALTEVLSFYGIPLPRDLDYATYLLALLIEAMLFYHHLHGRSMLDVQLHMYLVYTVLSCFACAAIEMKHRRSVLAALARTLLSLVQGVWFITVGWILYPPPGSPIWGKAGNEHAMHDEVMMATTIFSMHIAGAMIFAFIMGIVVSIRVKRLGQYTPTYEMRMPNQLSAVSAQYGHESNYSPLDASRDDDEDDDVARTIDVA